MKKLGIVVLLLVVGMVWPESSSAETKFQQDADIVRLQHLQYYAGLIEEYREKTGHYPFEPHADIRTYVHIANKHQEKYTTGDNPERHRVIDDSDFFRELSAKLGREVEELYDPQYVPVWRPNFYMYMIQGDAYFLAVHTYEAFPFANKVSRNYHKVEISNYSTAANMASDPDKLFASPEFVDALKRKMWNAAFFEDRADKHRFESRDQK